jgi:hypothetical protein
MSAHVMADGADGYRLVSGDDVVVGWVRGRVIGVSGFDDEAAAVSAAIRSHRELASWLVRQRLQPLPALDDSVPPRFVHDGAHRWLVVGRVQVARIPAASSHGADSRSHAFEIVLKGSVSEGMAIHAALVALQAAHGPTEPADIAIGRHRRGVPVSNGLAPTTYLDLEAR